MSQHTRDWSELAVSLYDKLTSRNAEITYEADDMEVWVPSGVGDDVILNYEPTTGTYFYADYVTNIFRTLVMSGGVATNEQDISASFSGIDTSMRMKRSRNSLPNLSSL